MLLFRPRDIPLISEWVNKRYLSKDESESRPGFYNNNTAPFGVEIMDSFLLKEVTKITLMGSAQISKTEIMKNIIGFIIDQMPAPMAILYPSEGDAREFSTEKLEPMFRNNKFLRDKIAPEKSNSKENKTLFKKFTGGFLAMFGSLVAQKLARRSLKYVFVDDSDRRGVAGSEGDSAALLWERTESFAYTGRKIWESSTPTIEGESNIEASYLKSDQRKYYVPCPYCGEEQILLFDNLIWEKDFDAFGETTKHYPNTVKLKCTYCEKLIDESQKFNMLLAGRWIATNPEIKDHRGYWINRLYSTFSPWSDIVKSFLKSKEDESLLQVFYNTVLAKTFKCHESIELDTTGLLERCEEYLTDKNDYRIPKEVLVLVLIADMQPDRLEYQVIGFGMQNESWQIEYGVLYGDVDQDDVWNDLEAVQQKKWKREDGVELGIHYRPGWDFPVFVDSGGTGSNTQSCYKQCKKRYYKGWMPIKGEGGDDKPILLNVSNVGAAKDIHLQKIGVDAAKNTIHKMLRTYESPVKMHFTKAFSNLQYFEQLTSERKIKELNRRTNRHHWIWKKKSPHARNEVLDIWAYSLACILKLNPRYLAIEKRLKEKVMGNTEEKFHNKNILTVEQNKKIIKRKIHARRRA